MSGEILESEIGATEALQEGIVPGGPTIAEVDEANATETYVSRAPRRGYVILSALATPFVAASAAIAANQSGAPRALADATPIEQTFGGFDPALSAPTTGAEALAQISPAAGSVFEGTSVLRPTATEVGKYSLHAAQGGTPDQSYIQYAELPRYTQGDRPDDPQNIGKPQFHWFYMVPQGCADKQLDTNGVIDTIANYQEQWLSSRTPDKRTIFRNDTYTDPVTKKRGLDVTEIAFPPIITAEHGFQYQTTCADLAFDAHHYGAAQVNDIIRKYVLPQAHMDFPNKIAVVVLEGRLGSDSYPLYCGNAGYHPPDYVGNTTLLSIEDPACSQQNNHVGDGLLMLRMMATLGIPPGGVVYDDQLDIFGSNAWQGLKNNVDDMHLDLDGNSYMSQIMGGPNNQPPANPYFEKMPFVVPKNTVEVDVTGRGEIDMISASLGKRACISAVKVKQCLYSVPATEKPRFTEVERYKDSKFAGWGGNVTPGMGKNRQLQDVGSRKIVRGKFVKRTPIARRTTHK